MPKKKIAPKRTAKKPAKLPSSKSRKTATKQQKELDPSAKRFVRDLLIRGDAVKPGPGGELPPGATHRIVEDEEEGGLPKVERERFSLY